MKQFFVCLILAVSSSLFGGSADAVIRGKTQTGRTELEVRVGDIEGSIKSVKLTIDGESYLIVGDDSVSQTLIRDVENQVYVLVVEGGGKLFRMWMVPGSEKVLKKGSGVFRSRFAAVVEATDPRKDKDGQQTPRITIGCTLDWEI